MEYYEEVNIYDEQEETWVNMDMVVHQEKKSFSRLHLVLCMNLLESRGLGQSQNLMSGDYPSNFC